MRSSPVNGGWAGVDARGGTAYGPREVKPAGVDALSFTENRR